MSEIQVVALAFSQEEVVYLMAAMGARFIPGMGDRLLPATSRDETQALLSGAERSLVARGLLQITADGPPQVEDLTLALVGDCAFPTHSLLIEPQDSGDAHYFHVGVSHLTVEHTVPQPGIHLFTAYKDEGEALAHIYQLLALENQPAPAGNSATLDESTLAIAIDLATSSNIEQLQQLLASSGFDQATAASLTASLGDLKARTRLIGVIHDPTRPQLHDYTLLLSGSGYWLAERAATATDRLNIRPIAAADLQALLSEQLLAAPAAAPVA